MTGSRIRNGLARRRAAAALTGLALAASGAAWSGCGDDKSDAEKALDEARKQSETIQQTVQEQVNDAQKQAEKLQDQANKQLDEAQKKAQELEKQAQDYSK